MQERLFIGNSKRWGFELLPLSRFIGEGMAIYSHSRVSLFLEKGGCSLLNDISITSQADQAPLGSVFLFVKSRAALTASAAFALASSSI